MEKTNIYVNSIRCFKKHDNAPNFVLGEMVINVEEFIAYLQGEGKQYFKDYKGTPQLRLQVLQSDKSGINLRVDNYQSQGSQSAPTGKIKEGNPTALGKNEKTTQQAPDNSEQPLPF